MLRLLIVAGLVGAGWHVWNKRKDAKAHPSTPEEIERVKAGILALLTADEADIPPERWLPTVARPAIMVSYLKGSADQVRVVAGTLTARSYVRTSAAFSKRATILDRV